jgi:hypothetical protein
MQQRALPTEFRYFDIPITIGLKKILGISDFKLSNFREFPQKSVIVGDHTVAVPANANTVVSVSTVLAVLLLLTFLLLRAFLLLLTFLLLRAFLLLLTFLLLHQSCDMWRSC